MAELAGSFALGPTIDGEYLPRDPIEAMSRGEAHRVPLIVGNNADEGKLFTRFLEMMPMTEPVTTSPGPIWVSTPASRLGASLTPSRDAVLSSAAIRSRSPRVRLVLRVGAMQRN